MKKELTAEQKRIKEVKSKKIKAIMKRVAFGVVCALLAMLLLFAAFSGWFQGSKN